MKNTFSRNPVVIIGGGVAGLTAANLLARNGFAVRVLEANNKLGGCCATTKLDDYTFNDGAVFLAVINVLDHAFSRVALNRAELRPLRKIVKNFATTLPDGTVVSLSEGLDLTVTGRTIHATCLQGELRRMLEKWQPILRFVTEELVLHPFSFWRMLGSGWRHLPRLRGTVASELNRLFSDRAVRSALSGSLLYNGLPAEKMPVSAILGLIAEIGDGFYVPEGGMGRVSEVLASAAQARGVTICLSSKVDKIIIEEGGIRGVHVMGSGRVDAAAVISTASGMLTFGSLIEVKDVPPAIRRRGRPRLSHRAVSVQFGLANRINAPAHSVNVLPWMEDQQHIFVQNGQEVKFPVYVVPTLTMPELAASGGSIIELFYPVRADIPLEYWNEQRKERLTELAIAALHRSYDLNIAFTRVRSPKDFLESMHLFQGALYGLSPAATPRDQFPRRSGIPGLFLAGQTTFPGYGVGAAMMSGIFAAEALAATA
jgi:phytoene desaturase